jgi:DNA modification methylase
MKYDFINELRYIVNDESKISDYTHTFYKYPARFSPLFARTIIQLFSEPSDIVFDPFMGGGTTIVEALINGRKAWGNDISSLAGFISNVKTTPLKERDILTIKEWAESTIESLNIHELESNDDYTRWNLKHLPWRMKKLINKVIFEIDDLPKQRQQLFARACLLKTSQWALDCKKKNTSVSQFKIRLEDDINELLFAINEYSQCFTSKYGSVDKINSLRILTKMPTEQIKYKNNKFNSKPKLVITSPPYPGVHVLYHRWQINGRRETDAPFWITNSFDGNSESYYTLGWRHQLGLKGYFDKALSSFAAIRNVVDSEAIVVQLLGFADRKKYLPKYLKMMEVAGFEEINYDRKYNRNKRIWRSVPNRKWYADAKGNIESSKEVVLIHRVKR